jgi:hypothetical protein
MAMVTSVEAAAANPLDAIDTDYESQSFLDLYNHCTGISETPRVYHQWMSILTIAAAVQDRVFVEKFKGDHLTPNLFLILLGPSGSGKGTAMRFSHKLLSTLPNINIWNGQITAPKMVDRLGKPTKDKNGKRVVANARLLLLTPELATSVGTGEMANKFVKLMTALYEGHADWSEGTRTSGDVQITNCNINWGAGSTPQWLIECLPKSSIDSGFLARTVVAPAEYNYDIRVPEPEVPCDFEEVYDHLKYRVFEYGGVRGEFAVTDKAREIHHKWYMTRPQENDIALEAAWHRDDDLCWKLAMILALAEAPVLVIEARHIAGALLLAMASQTPETEVVEMVRQLVQKARQITHRMVLQKLGARGKRARDIRDAVFQLRQMGELEIEYGPKGGAVYVWKG